MLETYHRRTEPVGKGGRRLLHGLASSPPWTNVTMALAGLYGLGAWGLRSCSDSHASTGTFTLAQPETMFGDQLRHSLASDERWATTDLAQISNDRQLPLTL